jgi:hypothetical protein
MASEQRDSSYAHIASAIAQRIEVHRESSGGRQLYTLRGAVLMSRKLAKTNVQTNPCDRRELANASSLYLALTPSPSRRLAHRNRRNPAPPFDDDVFSFHFAFSGSLTHSRISDGITPIAG